MSLEITNWHWGNHPIFGNITENETLIEIQTWRFSIDWNYDYRIKIPKDYWHSFELVLRFGGGEDGFSSWWLETKRFDKGEVINGQYGEMHMQDAVKCAKQLPLRSIKTFDNIKGMNNLLRKAFSI